jgi:hypothetical protein
MKLGFVLVSLFFLPALSHGLFEEAVAGGSNLDAEPGAYELNGSMRGVLYGGRIPEEDAAEVKSSYAEAALRLRVRKQGAGSGYAELRFRKGQEYGVTFSDVTVREAYVSAYVGRFDIRIGHQIVAWGRADGYNPTDIVTPKNMLVRSPDEDDRRIGNVLVRCFWNASPMRLESIFIPTYEPSVIPTAVAALPAGTSWGEPDYADQSCKNMGGALKLHLERASLDGSLSYFNGHNTLPGIRMSAEATQFPTEALLLIPTSYRIHLVGADFSTTVGAFGLRGEAAYRTPHDQYEDQPHIPYPDLQLVLGGDKEFGNLSLMLQYIGRFVFDFEELVPPQLPEEQIMYEVELRNRMLQSQQHERIHAVSFRPALTLLHETASFELLGLYNVTTEELYLRPKASYDIADALSLTVGGDLYHGPDDTLFGTIDETVSSLFVELRTSF